MNIGFSTGSLAKGDFRYAIEILRHTKANVIELSALREQELMGLIDSIPDLDLSQFNYISFHAPSKLSEFSEDQLIEQLLKVAALGYSIIVHPDIITDVAKWGKLGKFLCIENMDKRKPVGRTTKDLEMIFEALPEARFCLDLAHARQVDPTMSEALLMLKRFSKRLIQIHLSSVNSTSHHESLNFEALLSYSRVSNHMDKNIPIVLESPIPPEKIGSELLLASFIFDKEKYASLVNNLYQSHTEDLDSLQAIPTK